MRKHYLILPLLLSLVSSKAMAVSIVIDPDAFPNGTILNNAFSGVTLSAIGDSGVLVNANVLSGTDAHATTGTRVFADTSTSSTAWGNGSFSFLRVDFINGATSVSLDFAANDDSDRNPFLKAFDSNNLLVATKTVAGLVPLDSPVTLTVSALKIAYVTASWDETNRSDNGVLDNLRYEPIGPSTVIPEPSTLTLLGLGVFGLASGSWLKRKRAA